MEALTFPNHPSAGCPPAPSYAAQTVRIQLPVCAGLITGWYLGSAIGSEGLKNNTLFFGAVHVAATIIGKSWNDFGVVSFRAEGSFVLLGNKGKTTQFLHQRNCYKNNRLDCDSRRYNADFAQPILSYVGVAVDA